MGGGEGGRERGQTETERERDEEGDRERQREQTPLVSQRPRLGCYSHQPGRGDRLPPEGRVLSQSFRDQHGPDNLLISDWEKLFLLSQANEFVVFVMAAAGS